MNNADVVKDTDGLRAGGLRPGDDRTQPARRGTLGARPARRTGGPDAEQMVTLVAIQDTVRVAQDWPVELYTVADAHLEACLLRAETEQWQARTRNLESSMRDQGKRPTT